MDRQDIIDAISEDPRWAQLTPEQQAQVVDNIEQQANSGEEFSVGIDDIVDMGVDKAKNYAIRKGGNAIYDAVFGGGGNPVTSEAGNAAWNAGADAMTFGTGASAAMTPAAQATVEFLTPAVEAINGGMTAIDGGMAATEAANAAWNATAMGSEAINGATATSTPLAAYTGPAMIALLAAQAIHAATGGARSADHEKGRWRDASAQGYKYMPDDFETSENPTSAQLADQSGIAALTLGNAWHDNFTAEERAGIMEKVLADPSSRFNEKMGGYTYDKGVLAKYAQEVATAKGQGDWAMGRYNEQKKRDDRDTKILLGHGPNKLPGENQPNMRDTQRGAYRDYISADWMPETSVAPQAQTESNNNGDDVKKLSMQELDPGFSPGGLTKEQIDRINKGGWDKMPLQTNVDPEITKKLMEMFQNGTATQPVGGNWDQNNISPNTLDDMGYDDLVLYAKKQQAPQQPISTQSGSQPQAVAQALEALTAGSAEAEGQAKTARLQAETESRRQGRNAQSEAILSQLGGLSSSINPYAGSKYGGGVSSRYGKWR